MKSNKNKPKIAAIKNLPAMEELKNIIAEIDDLNDRIKEAKERLKEIPLLVSYQLENESDRLEAARLLYWTAEEVPVSSIKLYLLNDNAEKYEKIKNSSLSGIVCNRCGRIIKFKSRSDLQNQRQRFNFDKKYGHNSNYLCESCTKIENMNYQKEREELQKKHLERISDLKSMPYSEYLKTPEWQMVRKQQLKRSGFRCQVCNRNNRILNVHHRTYDNLGEESYKDLIVLCNECHKLFHESERIN